MKRYFAVDTSYVLKKLFLLVFPYTHRVRIIGRCSLFTHHTMHIVAPHLAMTTHSYSPPPYNRTGLCNIPALRHKLLVKMSILLTSTSLVRERGTCVLVISLLTVMGFVTYILLTGLVFGTQQRLADKVIFEILFFS